MNFRSLFYYLGWFNIPIIGLSVLVLSYSYYADFYENILSYYIVFFFSVFFLFLSRFVKQKVELKKNELLFLTVVGWLIFPIILAIPYYISGYHIDLFKAYFESMSGFSGYGFSIFNNPNGIDDSLLLWRSGTQWVGGFYYLFTIISILSKTDINFVPSSYISRNKYSTSFENKFVQNFFNIFYCYFLLSLFILFILNFTSLYSFEKINLMMTAASSGGFFIKQELILSNSLDKFIVSISFLFSSLNIFILYELFKFSKNYSFKEDMGVVILALLSSFALLILFSFTDSFYDIFLLVITSLSTSGINLQINFNSSYLFFLLILTFVGGSIFSTGSGFKFMRILFFVKKYLIEITKLLNPSIVLKKNIFDSKESIKNSDYYVGSLIFISYLLILSIGCLILSFNDLTFGDVFKIVFLTLNNTLPLNYLNDYLTFNSLNYFSHSILLILMFFSKVYLISLLVIFKKLLWK
jgi:trk system potassium uptake protein TrkH